MSDDEIFGDGEITPLIDTVQIGDQNWIVRDRGLPVQFVDCFTENRAMNGVAYLSLGSTIIDGQNQGGIDVACRLRMSLVTAQVLRDELDRLVKAAMEPADKSKAN
ncbi:hypothetical protein [Tateyamaria sp.]|uniref:hypothetical protein n=1 Tax=Tateyamaria sp. TaxID=1929288 RepID=UPI003B21DCB6